MQIARDSNVPAKGIRHGFSHRQGVLGSLSGRLAALTRNAPGPSSAWHATATRDRREAVCPQFARTGFIGVWRVFKLLAYLAIPAGLTAKSTSLSLPPIDFPCLPLERPHLSVATAC